MEELVKALKVAVDMEKSGHDVYVKAARNTTNKLGKATLEAIAVKELDHIKAIKEFIDNLSGGKIGLSQAIKDIEPKGEKDYVKSIIAHVGNKLEGSVKPDSDLEKAYEVAMELEKRSFDLYKKLSQEAENADAKKFFVFLMGEENTHYELLQETLEYLNKPKDWFEEKERWIMEG